ncbi:MAG: alpha/beta hydrolase [Verrucomicrobiales bacterium]|nr:alpha/beta hydrolase [Verrucomicrobiales bacterium]MCP5525235.1 alpha/beta hydrolase [Verrucomicrobiales bacterium]
MTLRRFIRGLLLGFLVLVVAFGAVVGAGWWYFHPSVQRTNAVRYGTRGARPLQMDVIRPARPNGLGVLVLVSGRWKSGEPGSFGEWITAALLRRGYTLFAIYHVSQPEASVPEIVTDMHRAVRFVRSHAKEYGVDPDRLGVTGGSAGGHLSLMLATRGGAGPAEAPDSVDRASSAVQAVAVFYPVTDLLNLGASTENLGDGGPPKSFRDSFGPGMTNLALWKVVGRECSPIFHFPTNLPPVLIYHGDADTLVPLDQSERFRDAAQAAGQTVEVRVHPGGEHGWLSMIFDVYRFADWFDEHLVPRAGKGD